MKRNGNNRAMMASKAQMPRGWRLVRLGDVAEVAFSGVDKRTIEGEFPVKLCNYTDVFYNRHIQASMDFMPATATQSELKRWALKQGDVLFTKDSETADEIGIPAFVADDLTNVLCGYHLGLARPSQAMVNGSFLARTLASRASAQEFGRIANGITRFGLTLDATRNLAILLPPLPEQMAIAAVLDSIDDAIEGTEAVIAATEQLRDSLLHQLLTRGVPGWHTEWKEAPGLGTIPAAWEVVRLGEVCAPPEYGASASARPFDPKLPRYVRITDITDDGRLRKADVASADPSAVDGYELGPGDLLFARSGATVGKTYLYRPEDGPCVYAGYLIRFRPLGEMASAEFLERFTRSQLYWRWVESMFRAGAQPNINAAEYSSLPVVLPPMKEQQAIAALLDGVDATIAEAKRERDGLQLLKESAADALLLGRVRVEKA